MKQKLKQLTAAFLIAVALVVCLNPTTADAAPARVTNLYFRRWDKADFTAFSVRFTAKQYIDGAQFKVTRTNGQVELLSKNFDDYCYKGSVWEHSFWNFPNNHILIIYTRVYRYNSNGRRVYSAWSNPVFMTPSPVKNNVKASVPNKKKPYIKLKWSPIYGCNGYNVFVTTNPSGKWYWNQSRAGAMNTSATIKKFRGKSLKTKQTYYVRVASRRKRNGVYCGVMFPGSSFWNCRFIMSK